MADSINNNFNVTIDKLFNASGTRTVVKPSIGNNSYHLTPFLVLADLLMVYFTAWLAADIRANTYFTEKGQILAMGAAPLVTLLFAFSGVYQSWRIKGAYYFLQRLFVAVWLAFAVISLLTIFIGSIGAVDRVWFALWFVFVNLGAFGYRYFAALFLNWLRVHGVNNKSVVLIGSSEQLQLIQTHFWKNSKFGVNIVESISVDKAEEHWSLSEFDARHIQDKFKPDDIWICLPLSEAHRIKDMMYQLRDSLANIRYIPHTGDLMLLNHRINSVMGFNSIDLNYSPLSGANHYLKLVADFVIASFILLLISPVMLLIAWGVKLSSPGPVFFKQKRLGMNGKPIKVYKFRSMKVHEEKAGKVTQATKNDSRITRFGAFLRSSSLDELPQFINVLQGRMSIVGPRPHAMAHNDYYKDLVDSYMLRHRVKPGITGWAQVNGFRGETDTLDKMEKRVQHDLWYIENWSLWLDIRIIVGTAFKGFFNPNAY